MRKRRLIIPMFALLFLSACIGPGKEKKEKAECVVTVEAKTGVLTGNAEVKTVTDNGSELSYVSGFLTDGDTATVSFDIENEGFYDLSFLVKSEGGYKENYVLVDGVEQGTIKCDNTEFEDSLLRRVFLSKGSHSVGIKKYWGCICWDKLSVFRSEELPKDIYEVSPQLVNFEASDNAKRLMNYLTDIYGEKILSGQYADGGYASWEVFKLKEVNGQKTPAVIGLEMGHCCKTAIDNNFTHTSVEDALDAWEKGGIVTMCYHWLAPEKYVTGIWWNGFRSEAVDIPLEKIMNGEDEEGMKLILNDIDILAKELQPLKDADVPVLFRPLHEASGGWFWWGDHGAEAYKKLYVLMYERLTNEHGLNNLIWLWNGQSEDWYPGDEYVDIIGTDIYPGEQEYSSQVDSFLTLHSWLKGKNKMIVLSENGTMPDIDACVRDGAMWGFFATWSGEFVLTDGLVVNYSEKYTQKDMVKKIYNHESVLTLDELPDLKNYRLR